MVNKTIQAPLYLRLAISLSEAEFERRRIAPRCTSCLEIRAVPQSIDAQDLHFSYHGPVRFYQGARRGYCPFSGAVWSREGARRLRVYRFRILHGVSSHIKHSRYIAEHKLWLWERLGGIRWMSVPYRQVVDDVSNRKSLAMIGRTS